MSYPDNNPKTKFGLAKIPMHLVPPALIRGAAEAWANGAEKYGPFNWRDNKISSTVYYAACLRHLTDWYDRVDADDCAPDSRVHHLKHAAACIGMLLDTMGSEKLNDDRPVRCPALPSAQVLPEGSSQKILGLRYGEQYQHAEYCRSQYGGLCTCSGPVAPSGTGHHGV